MGIASFVQRENFILQYWVVFPAMEAARINALIKNTAISVVLIKFFIFQNSNVSKIVK